MKTTILEITLLTILLCQEPFAARGQGTFQNLNFESATVPNLPPGQFGSLVPISGGLPSWNGYLGTNQINQILHNNFFLGTASISILGPDWTFTTLIEGAYTVLLQPGVGDQGENVDVSISQYGTIPMDAQSLQFKSDSGTHHFIVSIGSQSIPAVRISVTPTIALYGVDISMFAGVSDNLRITALYNNLDSGDAFLDSIMFSNQPIPEPSTLSLFGLGALLLGWRFHTRRVA